MPTPKIILYTHKDYADGKNPIMLQVVINGKAKRKVIGKCFAKHWIESKCRVSLKDIEAPRINNEIEKALRNYGLKDNYTLRGLFQAQIDNFKIKQQVSRYNINSLVMRELFAFAKNVDFEDVTEAFIYKFAAHLNNSPGTIKEKMNVISAIFKQAKKLKVINENPFEYISFKKGSAVKSKLTIEEIRLIINAPLTGKLQEARDIFVACIYLRGIRIGDILALKGKNIIDGRLHYKEIKTGKTHNMHISPQVLEIFNRWSGNNKFGYIFSFLQAEEGRDKFIFKAAIRNAIAKISRYIKKMAKDLGITKNISTHTARHSFSRIANAVIKDTSITKDLIGHSTLAVHEKYISDISDDIEMDIYADRVLDQLKD